MDGYAFPYLSEYCYYYMAGYSGKALTCITIDVGEQVKQLVQQVCVYTVLLTNGACATGSFCVCVTDLLLTVVN